MRSRLLGAVCASVLFPTSLLHATTLDFEELNIGIFTTTGSETATTKDFSLTSLDQNTSEILIGGIDCDPTCATNGTQALYQRNLSFQFTHSGGQPFRFQSFDAGEMFTGESNGQPNSRFWAAQIDITGTVLGGGIIQTSFQLDQINDGAGSLADFEHFVLPVWFFDAPLTDLTITGSGGLQRNDLSLDNMQFTVIPIPPALYLFGSGLIGLVGVARRKAA